MKLKDIMTAGVDVLSPDGSLREAAQRMRSLDIGPLPVLDGDRVVVMLTDRDITIRRVLVMNRENRLVSIASLGDLAVDTGDGRMVGQILEDVSENPTSPCASGSHGRWRLAETCRRRVCGELQPRWRDVPLPPRSPP